MSILGERYFKTSNAVYCVVGQLVLGPRQGRHRQDVVGVVALPSPALVVGGVGRHPADETTPLQLVHRLAG